ncbi:hypothetical protein HNR65_002231 [Desulfosalsimonas propionicica]|uniref:Uncharacterized protein n=1 Tax=Desulfosalsimonas propionicica TaxID=332175 RepID=A0A7W0HL52_9BACT|nr:hypothetical protein [Desulfosalsimonas propionicica]MBA2881900.1 hypothetical protein [Desulfosalsimonas propionicica]
MTPGPLSAAIKKNCPTKVPAAGYNPAAGFSQDSGSAQISGFTALRTAPPAGFILLFFRFLLLALLLCVFELDTAAAGFPSENFLQQPFFLFFSHNLPPFF